MNADNFAVNPRFSCRVVVRFVLTELTVFTVHIFVSDIAIFVLKRDVKLQLTNYSTYLQFHSSKNALTIDSHPMFQKLTNWWFNKVLQSIKLREGIILHVFAGRPTEYMINLSCVFLR